MDARKKHIEGFTLAEVLLAVAIILVLAAIAIPAIMTAQTNMRLVELDNAAAQIANAAQTQMTAKKANGTWLSLVEKTDDAGKTDYNFSEAKNPPGGASDGKLYMSADQARQNGIVPGLSIDDTVRDGDYIIEFEATTANVISVFYSDGKAGFFDTPHPETKAAQDYYNTNSANRQQQTRRQANPLIGYYEGTPASATKAVALKSPVVSVSEEGKLLVRDPNIGSKGPNGALLSTKADIVVSKKDDANAAFMIGGLDETAATYTISTPDGSQSLSLANSGDTAIYELVEKTTADPKKDVYSIDLNEFARIVQADETAQKNGLAALIAQFAAGAEIKVEAKVTSTTASIPATATAFMPWPAKVGKLTVLVSTPWSKTLAEKDISGGKNPDHLKADSYTQPIVKATTTSDGPSQTITAQDEEENLPFKSSQINTKLIGLNKQAGWQSYVGASVLYSEAANDNTFVLKALAGAYRSSQTGKVHQYQVEELWVQLANGDCTRVGTIRNGTWEWVEKKYASLDLGLTWNDAAGNKIYDDIAGRSTEGVASISILASEWGSAPADLGIADADGNVVLYVRTAPSTAEVQEYFDGKAARNMLKTELGEYRKISARGVNQTVNTTAGVNFESEFGASSSDVAWTLAVDNDTGFNNGNTLASKQAAVRVYYALAPGLGFKNIQAADGPLGLRSTEITNAYLWMYLTKNEALAKQPAAQVRSQVAGAYRFTATGGATDFELNAVQDYRYYRAITYYDEDGTTLLATPAQYVPYTAMDSDNAVIAAGLGDKAIGDTEWQFVGWMTEEEGLLLQPGARIADYDAQLSYKGVKLKATYKEKPKPGVGLMYLEFDGNGYVTGYYGSVDGLSVLDGLPQDNAIDQWGYYVIVPTGAEIPRYQAAGNANSRDDWRKCALSQNAVQIGDLGVFDLYKAPTDNPGNRTVTIPFKDGSGPLPDWETAPDASPTYIYSYNFDFAAAVALGNTGVKVWGKDTPWMVRHYDQFPAMTESLKGYGSNAFKQGHDIDFVGRGMHIVGAPFTGKYNGNGFVIWNAPYERITQDYFTALGLIPRASGAEFINMHLRFTQNISGQLKVTDGGEQGFGLLVGSAENSSFENCSVDGLLPDDASKLSPKLHFSMNGYAGGIVGLGTNSKLSNCAVANVEFNVVGTGNKQLGFGGLVGWLDPVSGIKLNYTDDLSHTVVAGVRFESTAKGDAVVGALAGFANSDEIAITGDVTYSVIWKLNAGDKEITDIVGKPIG